ncbi:MAG: polyprenyl synthetase family protein [Elusimicrobiales bacterium]|jgi:octaprenyl-diphosphate synthase
MNQPPPLDDSLARINREINSLLDGVDKAVYDHGRNDFNFMGKAVRSRFTLLLGDALGLERTATERVSAAAELVHTASLMHDDCIDRAALRRGLPTLNEKLGINTAILVGDLVVSFAFDYAVNISPSAPGDLVRAVRRMTEGALLEENSRYKKIPAAEAERILRLKTGELFRWCALTAAYLAKKPDLYEICGTIGVETGAAFQIVDDVLDFEGETGLTGKDALKDITEGRMTLPLILALNDARFSGEIEKDLAALKTGRHGDLAPALRIAGVIKENGFAAEARTLADKRIRALEAGTARLPGRDAAGAFKDYIRAFSSRTR